MYFLELLTELFCRNDFAWIQKTMLDMTGYSPPNSDDNFFGAALDSESVAVLGRCSIIERRTQGYLVNPAGQKYLCRVWS